MCFLDFLQCFLYISKLRVPKSEIFWTCRNALLLYKRLRLHITLLLSYSSLIRHKNHNFLDCDWFKELCSINSPVKLLSESLLSDSLLSDSSISQSYSKLGLKSTNHIKSCSLNQPIVILLMQISLPFITWLFLFLGNFNFYDWLVKRLCVVQFGP